MKNATACNVADLKSQFVSAAEDARLAARRGWRAAWGYVDDVKYGVKKEPLKSMCVTFGVAFGCGAFAAWLATRKY
jgi:hypothetical protein